ncbi:MAG: cytochrome c [Sterolibacterium sp.]
MKSLCLMLCIFQMIEASAQSAPEPTPARQRELIRLVRQDCGSCHGMTLKGGLGSPLVPNSLRDKPASSLAATVVHGRPGTAMPPWKTILAEGEAEWIVSQLLNGFPNE